MYKELRVGDWVILKGESRMWPYFRDKLEKILGRTISKTTGGKAYALTREVGYVNEKDLIKVPSKVITMLRRMKKYE